MGKSLSQWELDYLKRQERVMAYARQISQPRLRQVEKILVYHPDEHRRYLQQHPCEGCMANPWCDEPCAAYLRWYNARLAAARIRAQK